MKILRIEWCQGGKMTDRQKLLDLLREFKLEPQVAYEPRNVQLEAKRGNVDGHEDVYALFEFDNDGKFTKLGLWN